MKKKHTRNSYLVFHCNHLCINKLTNFNLSKVKVQKERFFSNYFYVNEDFIDIEPSEMMYVNEDFSVDEVEPIQMM